MKIKALFAVAPLLLLAACAETIHMTAVDGPVTQQNPVPVIAGHVEKMDVLFSTPAAESCQGHLNTVAPDQPASDLEPAWDRVYGIKYYANHITHTKSEHYIAEITCNKGTTMHIETFQTKDLLTQGIAKDSSGNLYKVSVP